MTLRSTSHFLMASRDVHVEREGDLEVHQLRKKGLRGFARKKFWSGSITLARHCWAEPLAFVVFVFSFFFCFFCFFSFYLFYFCFFYFFFVFSNFGSSPTVSFKQTVFMQFNEEHGHQGVSLTCGPLTQWSLESLQAKRSYSSCIQPSRPNWFLLLVRERAL